MGMATEQKECANNINANNDELTNDADTDAATHSKLQQQQQQERATHESAGDDTNSTILTPTQPQQQQQAHKTAANEETVKAQKQQQVPQQNKEQEHAVIEEVVHEIHLPTASPPPQVITIPPSSTTTTTSKKHEQQQQQQNKQAAATVVVTNAAKKVRRAFSMPRNPFRWSRKFKTENPNAGTVGNGSGRSGGGNGISNSTLTSCVGGGRGRTGSIVSLNSYEAISKDTNGNSSSTNIVNPASKANEKNNAKRNMQSNNIDGSGNIESSSGGKATSNGTLGMNSNSNNKRILRRSSFRKFLNRIAHQLSNSINVGGKPMPQSANKTTTSSTNGVHYIDIIPYYTGCWRRKKANKQAAAAAANAAQIIPTTGAGAAAVTTNTRTNTLTSERVPPINGYQWPADQTPGVMGLKNHGNTCFMNAVLQCLSHTDILAEYFVLDQYKADLKRRNKINSRKFGTKGELTEQLANVLKALWTCKNESDHSTSFKAVVERYGSQFRSSTQHDAQEFLFWLLDKVHEDLNTATKRRYKSVKNNYGRPDEVLAAETLANHIRCNNSFVQAVFQAQFRSSLTCPRCEKQSNTFDPFHCVSVQLPQLTQQIIFVTVVYSRRQQQPQQMRYGLTVPAGSPIIALREQLQIDARIASERLVLVDLGLEGFQRVFYDSQPVATLNGIETIYCIETPEVQEPKTEKIEQSVTTDAATAGTKNESNAKSTASTTTTHATDLLLLVANVRQLKLVSEDIVLDDATTPPTTSTATATSKSKFERFGAPFSMRVPRDCSYTELQKKLLREMSAILKPEVFSYATPLTDMFRIRLQDPSAEPDTFIEQVEHPLLHEMIDLALSVLSAESGPPHVKLLLEWSEPEQYFQQLTNTIVDHESVARLREQKPNETAALTLDQCLEHYTRAETLSAEDAWRCPHCQQYLPVVKTLGLWSLPDILVVHFKRFRQHHGKGQNAAKLTTMVKFPLTDFDMSPHLARGSNGETPATTADVYRPSPWRKSRPGDSRSSTLSSRADYRETRYDLYAVCYHQGDTLETGHYTAACKNPYDRQWYKFDDQRVAKVPQDTIQEEIINNEAYMLFYQRRPMEGSECSGSSSNSGDHWISRIAPPLAATSVAATALTVPSVAVASKEPAAAELAEKEKETPKSDRLPEKAESQPVDIPKVGEEIATATTPVKEELVVASVIPPLHSPLHVDAELNFADDDGNNETTLNDKEPELQLKESLDSNEIFDMDEDTAQTPQQPTVATILSPKDTPKQPISPIPAAETNGHHAEVAVAVAATKNGKASSPKSHTSRASSSASSSDSSLSSRSSPNSLAASTIGATTLQTKFNSFGLSNQNTLSSSYKERGILNAATNRAHNTTFKSNSSSIIAVAARSHEFQITRHQPQHHWHGSRSSISALENATHQQSSITGSAHAHGLNLRHSFSTSSNYKFRECSDTLSSLLRNSANTCSKDTLLFIDQQNHHSSLMEDDDDDSFMGSRSLWISPVTPHKLITVSPKN